MKYKIKPHIVWFLFNRDINFKYVHGRGVDICNIHMLIFHMHWVLIDINLLLTFALGMEILHLWWPTWFKKHLILELEDYISLTQICKLVVSFLIFLKEPLIWLWKQFRRFIKPLVLTFSQKIWRLIWWKIRSSSMYIIPNLR